MGQRPDGLRVGQVELLVIVTAAVAAIMAP
jgi:hypothetical protein